MCQILERSITQNRRISNSFKENALNVILIYTLKLLNQIMEQIFSLVSNEQQNFLSSLLLQCLKTINDCFTFDFVARFDDTMENYPYNLIPSSWSNILQNIKSLQYIVDVIFKVQNDQHQIIVSLLIFLGFKNYRRTF